MMACRLLVFSLLAFHLLAFRFLALFGFKIFSRYSVDKN